MDIVEKRRIGEVYNLGSGEEKRNIDIAKALLYIMKKDIDLIEYVKNRLGHDIRYGLNSQKVFRQIGWQPKVDFKKGLENTVSRCFKPTRVIFITC